MGIPVDYYVLINLQGFSQMVDALAVKGVNAIKGILEAGVPGYDHTLWQGVFLPASTPRRVRHQAREAVALMAFSATTSTALAAGLLLLAHAGR